MSYKIAPSILAADYANFASELARIDASGAEYVHIDIMWSLACVNIASWFLIATLWLLILNVMWMPMHKLVQIS